MLTENQARAIIEKTLKGKFKIVSTKDAEDFFVFVIDTTDEQHAFIDPIAIDKNTREIKLYSPVNNFGRNDDG